MIDDKLAWHVARSAGIVAWGLSALTVAVGLALAGRLIKRPSPPARLDLHSHLGNLTLLFVVVHLVALWADTFETFGWLELFVPMASRYRPGAVAVGIVATYLLVAIQLTSWTMRRLPRRVWRLTHHGALPLFLLSTWHGYAAGTDRSNRLLLVVGAVAVALLGTTTAWRLRRFRRVP